MTEARSSAGQTVLRIAVYALLTACALVMLFPFLFMLSTSFKNSTDVFRYPPRLLPYRPELAEQGGEARPVFNFNVEGQARRMAPTGERVPCGSFTTQEHINAASPRESTILAQFPMDRAAPTGNRVTINDESGAPHTFEEYRVTVGSVERTYLLAYSGRLDMFVDLADSTVQICASQRTATPSEYVRFETENYNTVLGLNLDRALVNTTIVTVGVTLGQLVTSIFGGYAFARVRFRGRNTIFIAYLGSIMIPFVVLIIPMYRLMVAIGWQNRLVSLIVPWIFTAYGTFLMRQFFLTIPKDLEEAALMDGCSRLRILWRIFVPLSMPAVATLGIFSFLYAWNSFLWPLLIIGEGNEPNHVLTLSLIRLSNIAADRPHLVLTGAAIAIIPPILIFIVAQRWFIEGVATSGLKG